MQPGKKKKNEGVEQVAIRDRGRLSYHPELATGVNFLSRVQTLQARVMFSHRSGSADPAFAMGTRVAAAERGQQARAAPDLGLALLRSDGMWILNHTGLMLCHNAQAL